MDPNSFLQDDQDRFVALRGVNLAGSCKYPPRQSVQQQYFDDHLASFKGHPFATIQDAADCFSQLRYCGFNVVRFIVTWEALEHQGPGLYDDEYIDYLVQIFEQAALYDISVYVDPHQDCWSRFSGGSGAPKWTFEKVGINPLLFKETNGAHICDVYQRNSHPSGKFWPTNYSKFGSLTMFTLFFGGDLFASHLNIQDNDKTESIQQYLQTKYLDCYKYFAQRIKACKAVIGFDSMNEPHHGYIGMKDLNVFNYDKQLHYGNMPSAYQGMLLSSGYSLKVPYYDRSFPLPTKITHYNVLNKEKKKVWIEDYDIWKEEGVWDINEFGNAYLKQKDYFYNNPKTNKRIDFNNECLKPFIEKYIEMIKEINDKWIVFISNIPNELPINMKESNINKQNIGYSPHFYDLKILFEKQFSKYISFNVQELSNGSRNLIQHIYFGYKGLIKNYTKQLKTLKKQLEYYPENTNIIIGEIGIPFDINNKEFYYENQDNIRLLYESILTALDNNLLSYTLWNYNYHHNHVEGDEWNNEDFSIYSKHALNQYEDYKNLRIPDIIIRPYVVKSVGAPYEMKWNRLLKTFKYQCEFKMGTYEIFIPFIHFGYYNKDTIDKYLDIIIDDDKIDYHYKIDIDNSQLLLLTINSIDENKNKNKRINIVIKSLLKIQKRK